MTRSALQSVEAIHARVLLYVKEILKRELALWFCLAGNGSNQESNSYVRPCGQVSRPIHRYLVVL